MNNYYKYKETESNNRRWWKIFWTDGLYLLTLINVHIYPQTASYKTLAQTTL